MNETKQYVVEERVQATSYWKDVWRQFCKNKLAVFGLILLLRCIILKANRKNKFRFGPAR